MSNPYPILAYRGDLSDIPGGQLLGFDETFRPYEVIDAVFSGNDGECEVCGPGRLGHTHVYLQYASPENVRQNGQAFFTTQKMRGTIP